MEKLKTLKQPICILISYGRDYKLDPYILTVLSTI